MPVLTPALSPASHVVHTYCFPAPPSLSPPVHSHKLSSGVTTWWPGRDCQHSFRDPRTAKWQPEHSFLQAYPIPGKSCGRLGRQLTHPPCPRFDTWPCNIACSADKLSQHQHPPAPACLFTLFAWNHLFTPLGMPAMFQCHYLLAGAHTCQVWVPPHGSLGMPVHMSSVSHSTTGHPRLTCSPVRHVPVSPCGILDLPIYA